MDEERAREIAIQILDEVEELLAAKDIKIPSDDREGREEEACLYGSEYYQLEDSIVEILTGADSADSTRPGDGPAAHEHVIKLTLCEGDFEQSMGRKPRDEVEFEEWALLCEKGPCNGHIDWDIVYECAADAMDEREPSSDHSGDDGEPGVG